MSMNLELPEQVVEALGPEPERAALEAVLLFLISEDKMSVAHAGEILCLDRISAIRQYTSHGSYYPDLSEEDPAEELRHVRKPQKPAASLERLGGSEGPAVFDTSSLIFLDLLGYIPLLQQLYQVVVREAVSEELSTRPDSPGSGVVSLDWVVHRPAQRACAG